MASQADADDYWAQVVSLYTGYPMPSRKVLFDKLKSKDGIPLMRVHLVEHQGRAVKPEDYSAVAGWHASHGEDYRLAFYTHHGQDDVRLFTADITFIRPVTGDDGQSHLLDGGATRDGGTAKGKDGEDWDDNDLWRYISAPKYAFNELVQNHKTTHFSHAGVTVADVDAVDLESFDRTAISFDRAAKFFNDQSKILAQWNDDMGGDNAAWKGESADVVRNLIQTLHKNYENYVDQMGGAEFKSGHTMLAGHVPTTSYSETLFQAQWDLHFEAKVMESAWLNWANSGEHDPYRALLEELDELSRWILQNNVPHVVTDIEYTYDNYNETADTNEDLSVTTSYTFDTVSPFTDNPGFGALDDIKAWAVVGQRAVDRWNRNVEGYLIPAAKKSLSDIGKGWSTSSETLSEEVTTKHETSLSQNYQKQETKKTKEDSEKALDDATKKTNEGFQKLNDNLAAANDNNKGLFDGLNNNLTQSANSQRQLNDSLSGLGDSLGDGLNNGLSNLGNSFTQSLNPDPLGLDGGGNTTTSPLNTGLGDLLGNSDGTSSGTTLPLNPGSLLTNSSTGITSPLNPNAGSLLSGNPRLDDDGNLVQTYPDGTTTVYDPDTGQLVTTGPDGHTTTTQLNPGDSIPTPDGGSIELNPDGTLTTHHPDGTTTVFDPSDGTLQTTNPDGTHTTTQLNTPIDTSGLGGDTNLSYGGTSPLNNGALGDAGGYPDLDADADYLDYDSTPFTGGTLGGGVGAYDTAAANTSTSPTSGTPLNPGFGSGAGGAGAGAGGANGERVRSVLNDPSSLSALRRTGSVAPSIDNEAMPFRNGSQTSSTPMGGGAPMGGAQGGQSTESGERQRTNWVEEDEDVWGTEEGGTPAVLG
ncbi:AAWKG family protein [Streptomyces sp. NPDC090106]|uniref:AAWKG family protein n=1 Tax=Streptomyces sp. NPDC090106 TaxID=3365946 RepID=UPI0038187F55